MRESVDILLFVEHVARELDIACAVKHLLAEKHGLRLDITSMVSGRKKTLDKWDPCVVAIPYSYVGLASPDLREISDSFPKARFVDLAYEQLYHTFNKSFRIPRDDFARRGVLHHAWADFHVEFLKQHGVPGSRIVVNGNPACALYDKRYSRYFESKEDLARKHGLDSGKPWLLVSENYKAAFLPTSKIKWYIWQGASVRDAFDYRKFDRTSFAEVVRWWYALAEQGAVEVVVRPRPVTKCDSFAQACSRLAGELPKCLHIIKDGTIREWILASNWVMSSISTTLIEAAVAHRPVYMLMPMPPPRYLHMPWYDLVPRVSTESEFLGVTARPSTDCSWQALHDWARQTMLSRGDPIDEMASILAAVCSDKHAVPGMGGTDPSARDPGEAPVSATKAKRSLIPISVRILPCLLKEALVDVFGQRRLPCYAGDGSAQDDFFEMDMFGPQEVARRTAKWAGVLE